MSPTLRRPPPTIAASPDMSGDCPNDLTTPPPPPRPFYRLPRRATVLPFCSSKHATPIIRRSASSSPPIYADAATMNSRIPTYKGVYACCARQRHAVTRISVFAFRLLAAKYRLLRRDDEDRRACRASRRRASAARALFHASAFATLSMSPLYEVTFTMPPRPPLSCAQAQRVQYSGVRR